MGGTAEPGGKPIEPASSEARAEPQARYDVTRPASNAARNADTLADDRKRPNAGASPWLLDLSSRAKSGADELETTAHL
jgi:hypothetical protein